MENVKVTIFYMNGKIEESNKKNNLIIDILRIFSIKIKKDINELYFIVNGKKLLLNDLKKKKTTVNILKNKKIFAFEIRKVKNNWKLNNIICPYCKNLALMEYNKELISLKCSNKHSYEKLSLKEFIEYQHSDDIINCDICHKIKNIYNDEIYICNNCDKKLCLTCKNSHNKCNKFIEYENKFIEYKNKFDYCFKHKKKCESFCKDCNYNLCIICEAEDHSKHKILLFKEYKPKKKALDEIKKNIEELNDKIKKYKKELKILKEIFNRMLTNLMDNLDYHMNLNDYIYNSVNNLNNFYKIKNVILYKSEKIIKEINGFLNLKINDKFKNLIDKFNEKNIPFNQMELRYTTKSEKNIKLFGDEFFEKNKDNCYLIIDDKIEDFCQYYSKKTSSKFLKISLISENPITDMKNMFYECDSLKVLKNYNFDTSKVINMSNMFNKCAKLSIVQGIKNVEKVTTMNSMFKECKSLTDINDISNWNFHSLNDIRYMFSGCCKLTKISDNLFWDTSKINNMSYLFQGCSSLKEIPDISSWKTNEVINMSHMFENCKKLKSLPDISKWNINKVNNISYMFCECTELESLPDISEWDTINVNNMSKWLYSCESLKDLPDISKWNTINVTKMIGMFYYCKSLLKCPDISIWNTSKLIDISQMFLKCQSLTVIDNIYRKWDFNHIKANDFSDNYNMLFKSSTITEKHTIFNIKKNKTFTNEINPL